MGCDLIGYILIAPKKFAQGKINKAVRKLEKLHKVVDELIISDNSEPDFDVEEALAQDDMVDIRFVVDQFENLEGSDLPDLLQSIYMLTEDSVKFVEEVVATFENGDRSVMTRGYPANPKKFIHVCGLESWGDGFDYGTSGWYIERAEALGILSILGIE